MKHKFQSSFLNDTTTENIAKKLTRIECTAHLRTFIEYRKHFPSLTSLLRNFTIANMFLNKKGTHKANLTTQFSIYSQALIPERCSC